jgi:hypothetical protein
MVPTRGHLVFNKSTFCARYWLRAQLRREAAEQCTCDEFVFIVSQRLAIHILWSFVGWMTRWSELLLGSCSLALSCVGTPRRAWLFDLSMQCRPRSEVVHGSHSKMSCQRTRLHSTKTLARLESSAISCLTTNPKTGQSNVVLRCVTSLLSDCTLYIYSKTQKYTTSSKN